MPKSEDNSAESLASIAQKLSPEEFMLSARWGLDKILGNKTSTILMKTLDIVYNLDQSAIVSKPEIFEKAMKGILGDQGGNIVLCTVVDKIKVKIRNNDG